jgi:hypothetical protein
MPITYSERPITEQENEVLEADIRAWQQNLAGPSRRFLDAFFLFLGSVVTIAIAVMLLRTDIVVWMVLGGILCFCLLIFVFLIAIPNSWGRKAGHDAIQRAIATNQAILEKGIVQVVRVETERVALYDMGDEDIGPGYFIEIGPQETLYLSCSHWNWETDEEILISHDDAAPVIHTSFELTVEETLSSYHPLGGVLAPYTILTHGGFDREESPIEHRSFRLTTGPTESHPTYFFPQDRAIYTISLADLLDNPTKMHDANQDFL